MSIYRKTSDLDLLSAELRNSSHIFELLFSDQPTSLTPPRGRTFPSFNNGGTITGRLTYDIDQKKDKDLPSEQSISVNTFNNFAIFSPELEPIRKQSISLPFGGLSIKTLTDKCIVLDLDETLVSSAGNMATYDKLGLAKEADLAPRSYVIIMRDVLSTRGEGKIIKMWGIIRPHTSEFLIFCFSYFRAVIVWSAGKYGYVHEIVPVAFADICQPHAILTWDDCVKINDICVKDLSVLYNDKRLQPYVRPDNTLIVDDRTVSFKHTPRNGILIPPYSPDHNLANFRADDIALLQLRAWFLRPEVQMAPDVRELDKSEIFNRDLSSLLSTSDSASKVSRRAINLSQIYYETNSPLLRLR